MIENKGMDNQIVIETFDSLKEARNYLKEFYTEEDIDELQVDITFNGSTEY